MITTTGCYYMILVVYISLWSCQLVTCHLTHSLIVLTDSYINLYKILDISLGILHLKTQRKVRNGTKSKISGRTSDRTTVGSDKQSSIRLFDTVCSYQFKRLPVLGSFVNGLFLAALLMSAAIEGIQTCFHANHSGTEGQASILLEHPITYPGILVGFALVGAMMQWSSVKAHEMREQELDSESLLDVRPIGRGDVISGQVVGAPVSELDAGKLPDCQCNSKRNSIEEIYLPPPEINLNVPTLQDGDSRSPHNLRLEHCISKSRSNSFVPVPLDNLPPYDDQFTKISLKSLKLATETFDEGLQIHCCPLNAINSISKDLEAEAISSVEKKSSIRDRWWLIVRYCASPVALVACATIIYFIHDEMVTEIADATFAISVVILLFTASYPPMKKAGKVLLQTAPDGVDLDQLKRCLKSISPIILDIQNLHVWCLTAKSNSIATCHIVLNKDKIKSEKQVYNLLRKAKSTFMNQNIKCSTIQPIFVDTTN